MTSRVFTLDGLADEIAPGIENMMKPWLEKNPVNLPNILMAGMTLVEQFSSQVGQLSGADKLAVAKLLIPKLIDFAVGEGKLTQDEGNALKTKIANEEEMVGNIVSAFSAIAKNPAVIQAVEEVEAEVKGFCSGLCHKK